MINADSDIQNLTGKILLSTPSVSDEYLNKSMIYICSHDKKGAMGLVINKLIPNIKVKKLLSSLSKKPELLKNTETHFGGVDEMERCFILHSDDYLSSASVIISNKIALTINADIINVITSSGGPKHKIICMGCCMWEAEQLENEIASSYWIPIEADEALIFGDQSADKWSKALMKIGSTTNLFSSVHGNA